MGLLFKTPQEKARAAAENEEKKGQWIQAAVRWRALDEKARADDAWGRANFGDRGHFLASVGKYSEAGEAFEQAEDYEAAAEAFQRCDQPMRAAENWERSGDLARAADCYTALRAPERAAALYERAGNMLPAAMRWQEAGQPQRALKVFFQVRDDYPGLDPSVRNRFLPLLIEMWVLDFAKALTSLLDASAVGPWKTLHAVVQSQIASVPASLATAVALRAGVVAFLPGWCRSVFESGAQPNNEVHSVLVAWLMRQTARSPDTATVHLGAAWLAAWEGDADAVSRHVRASISADPARLDDALALLRTVADHLGKGRNGAYLAERIRLAVESL